ncbi:hypothetical protein PTKIN_Ptkin09bG0016100 [Pterospermum kingtungense]
MSSNYGRGSSGSLKNFDFDLGLGSGRPKSLNDQKNKTTSSFASSYSSSTSAQSKPSWQPNKPSWTHQPAANQASQSGLSGPTSMVGDIFGKSWGSSGGNSSGVGIVNKEPRLFGDLVSSALGQGKTNSNSNVPLKNSNSTSNSSGKSPYSMGNLADSLPKSTGNWGTSGGYGNSSGVGNVNVNINSRKNQNLGGPSMKSMAGGVGGVGGGIGIGSKKDPFGSLVDFSSKPSGSLNSGSNKGNKAKVADDAFGDFKNASKPSSTTFQSSGFGSSNNDFMGSNMAPGSNMDDFGMPASNVGSQSQPSVQSSGSDPLDMFFSSASASAGGATQASGGGGGQQFSGVDDWGLDTEFEGAAGTDEGVHLSCLRIALAVVDLQSKFSLYGFIHFLEQYFIIDCFYSFFYLS